MSGAIQDHLYFDNLSLNIHSFVNGQPVQMAALMGRASQQKKAISDIYSDNTHEVNESFYNIWLDNYIGSFDGIPVSDDLKQQFKINAGRLASAKSYRITDELIIVRNKTLTDPNEYNKLAQVIQKKYNRWQAVEQQTMQRRARVARQFESFKRTAHLYPNLEWVRTRSAEPREMHLRYVGIILPMEHKFFRDNVPGSLYGCKCSLQVTDKPATEPPEVYITPSPGLDGNPYYTHTLISDGHPYFTELPSHIPDIGVLRLPDEVAYIKRTTADGLSYFEHALVAKENMADKNRQIVEILLRNGYEDIRLLPQVNVRETTLRDRYYGRHHLSKTKCPDACIGTSLVEFKEVHIRNVSTAIKDASKKANIAVLKTDEGLAEWRLKGMLKQYDSLEEIILIIGDEVKSIKKAK